MDISYSINREDSNGHFTDVDGKGITNVQQTFVRTTKTAQIDDVVTVLVYTEANKTIDATLKVNNRVVEPNLIILKDFTTGKSLKKWSWRIK